MNSAVDRRGLFLGVVVERAVVGWGSVVLTLDHDLDVLPGVGRRVSVAELAGLVEDLAGRVRAAGVGPGDRVVVCKAANFDVWLLAVAVARAGGVPVMLSHSLDAATVAALLERLERPHLLCDAARLDALAGVPLPGLVRQVISVDGGGQGVVCLADLAGSQPVRPVLPGLDEPAMITHTSGTTGIPKLVVHTARTMRARLRPQLFLLALMRRRETVAIHVPFGHSRMFAAMALCLRNGLPVLLVSNPDPDHVAGFFAEHRPGLLEALPNSLMAWEALADDPRRPFASVKYFSSTFDAIHPRTIRRLLAASARRRPRFFQIYGQSEVGPAAGRPYSRRSARTMDGRCVGYTLPGSARVRVVAADGHRPTEQHPGQIEARWDGIARTYYGEQERYDANLHHGWWRTGDIGYRTRYGCLHMLDREIDTIPGIGSSLEIEDLVLDRLEELTELVIVPGPGSRPTPVVCTHHDQPLDLHRWHTATTEYPQLAHPVHIPLAQLPRTATLKTRRVELTRLLHTTPPQQT